MFLNAHPFTIVAIACLLVAFASYKLYQVILPYVMRMSARRVFWISMLVYFGGLIVVGLAAFVSSIF